MGLNDFLGNAPVLESVKKQLAQGRLPNSMLFAGIPGIGKRTLARFISKAANCLNHAHDFCDVCSSCKKINDNCHPDVRLILPEGQLIKIDQMRELSREVFFKPFEGRRRVYIIDEAEKMRLEAANSILKTLEEPPETTVLILISARPDDLLATIRSRCQIYQFVPLLPSAILQILSTHYGSLREEHPLLSQISGGSVGRALSLDLDVYQKIRHEMLDLIEVCTQDLLYTRALKLITPLAKDKECFDNKIDVLYNLLHDLFLLKVDPNADFITNPDVRDKLLKLCSGLTLEQIMAAAESLDYIEAGSKRNLNKGLSLDQFVFRFSGMLQPADLKLFGS